MDNSRSVVWVQQQEEVQELSNILGPHFREFLGASGTRYKVRPNGDVEVTKTVKAEDISLKH